MIRIIIKDEWELRFDKVWDPEKKNIVRDFVYRERDRSFLEGYRAGKKKHDNNN